MGWVALTREVSTAIAHCELTHLTRAPIDVDRAQRQHETYEATLEELGCRVSRLPSEPLLPDAVFVEDTAVVIAEIAIVARPGAMSRRAETASVTPALARYRHVVTIDEPATLDGGDVVRFGQRFFVGLSSRTSEAGVEALRSLVTPFGYTVTPVPVAGCLHLKSAATAVAANVVLLNPSLVDPRQFGTFAIVECDPDEPMAANALLIGETVVVAEGFPKTRARLEKHGLRVVAVDLSELAKAEGAVTCCSLLIETPGRL
jgi:dimethylargininase